MSSTLYHCIVCQQQNDSIIDLHNHHIEYHTLQELSLTVINLQGLQTVNNQEMLKISSSASYTSKVNNNENLYNPIINNTTKQNRNEYKTKKTTSKMYYETEVQSFHDAANCLVNCSQFIAWEHEWNKRTEINDDEFFDIINSLCNDLKKVKRKGRKRKSIDTNSTNTKSSEQFNQNQNLNIVTGDTKISNGLTSSASTTSSCNKENLNSRSVTVSNDEVLDTKIKKEINLDNSDTEPFEVIGIDKNKSILMYNPANGTFTWSSLSCIDSDLIENKSNTETSIDSMLENLKVEKDESSSESLNTDSTQNNATELSESNI